MAAVAEVAVVAELCGVVRAVGQALQPAVSVEVGSIVTEQIAPQMSGTGRLTYVTTSPSSITREKSGMSPFSVPQIYSDDP